jgi:hypothetical protein
VSFLSVNIIQDYAGEGIYGAIYALFINDALFGCPQKKFVSKLRKIKGRSSIRFVLVNKESI